MRGISPAYGIAVRTGEGIGNETYSPPAWCQSAGAGAVAATVEIIPISEQDGQ